MRKSVHNASLKESLALPAPLVGVRRTNASNTPPSDPEPVPDPHPHKESFPKRASPLSVPHPMPVRADNPEKFCDT